MCFGPTGTGQDGRPQTPGRKSETKKRPATTQASWPNRQLVFDCLFQLPASLHRLTVLHLLSSMAAAHLFCSAPAAYRAANPRPLATRGRANPATGTYLVLKGVWCSCAHFPRATPSRRFFPCRASLSPDGSLAMLGAPSPRMAPPMRKPYMREHSCLIFPPPRGRRPLAVIKFLGGAFIGAVPEVTYG
jgi:hypothetical protein